MIRACIFDLDGVIVDTAKYHYMAWKRLAYELGIEFTEQHNERLKGVSRIRSLEIILEIGGVELSEAEKTKCAERKNKWFVDYVNAMKPEEVFSGAIDLISELKARKFRVALASSSKNAQGILEHLKISNLFEIVVDGTMITHSKPDPEIFLLAANLLRLPPADCVVFEDAEAGIEAAHSAGMKAVGVGKESVLGNAEIVVDQIGHFRFEMLKTLINERVS